MAKLTLTPVTGSYASVAKLNANFQAIEDALENTLSRDGTTPNALEDDIDANSHTLINLPDATELTSPVTYKQLQNYVASSAEGLIAVQRDVATASAGQTVFNLNINYTPSVNNLFIFRNGSKLRVSSDYAETDNNTITLTSAANDGDVFEFFVNTTTTSEVTTASAVTISDSNGRYASGNVEDALQEAALASTTKYTPAGTGAVVRSVENKVRESVSVKDFGAVGDGVTDDTLKVDAAFTAANGRPVIFDDGDYYLGVSGYTLAAGDGAISYVDGAEKNVWLYTRRLTGAITVGQGALIGYSPSSYMWDTLEDCDVGADFFVASRYRHRFGGSSIHGGRIGLYSSIEQSAATNASNANRNYVGIQGSAYCNASDTGSDTGANAKGAFFGGGFATYVDGAAQNLLNVTAAEFNTFVSSGATVKYQFGLQIACANAQRGVGYDAALSISGLTDAITHAGYGVGILFSSANGAEPFSASSTIIAAVTAGSASVTHGIDFSTYTITGQILKGKYSTLSETQLVVGDAGGNSLIVGGSQSTNANLIMRPKGTGSFYIQNGAGTVNIIRCDETGAVLMENLPTSSAGLPSGALWKNGTVVNIV